MLVQSPSRDDDRRWLASNAYRKRSACSSQSDRRCLEREAGRGELESNRLELVGRQQQLSHALIDRAFCDQGPVSQSLERGRSLLC